LIGLVDQSHHQLGVARLTQPRLQPGLLDLLHAPGPVARGFQRHRRAWRTPGQVAPHGTGRVRQPDLLHDLPARHVFSFHQAVPLVAVKGDILSHARLLFFPKRDLHRQPTLTAGVALSYIHSEPRQGRVFSLQSVFRGRSLSITRSPSSNAFSLALRLRLSLTGVIRLQAVEAKE